MADRILRIRGVVEMTSLAQATVYRMIRAGTFPRGVDISPRAVGWRVSDIDAWIAKRPEVEPVGLPQTK
jgi:prophage regulatory protein